MQVINSLILWRHLHGVYRYRYYVHVVRLLQRWAQTRDVPVPGWGLAGPLKWPVWESEGVNFV